MNPVLPAAALTGCFAAAWWGIALVRERGPLERFDEGVDAEHPEAARRGPVGRSLDYLAHRLAPRGARILGERKLSEIRHRIDAAGRPGGLTIERYAGVRMTHLVLYGGVGVLLALGGNIVVGAILITFGWFWLDFWLARRARVRRDRVDADLPDFLDILAVTVGAGVGFRPAMQRVADSLGGPLAEELTTALRQMDLGATRRDAFVALRRRTDSEFLSQFVTALLQAEELGVPLSDALRSLASEMRQSFHQNARRRAARAAPRVSLIVSLVVVPGAVALILGALLIGSGTDMGALFG